MLPPLPRFTVATMFFISNCVCLIFKNMWENADLPKWLPVLNQTPVTGRWFQSSSHWWWVLYLRHNCHPRETAITLRLPWEATQQGSQQWWVHMVPQEVGSSYNTWCSDWEWHNLDNVEQNLAKLKQSRLKLLINNTKCVAITLARVALFG